MKKDERQRMIDEVELLEAKLLETRKALLGIEERINELSAKLKRKPKPPKWMSWASVQRVMDSEKMNELGRDCIINEIRKVYWVMESNFKTPDDGLKFYNITREIYGDEIAKDGLIACDWHWGKEEIMKRLSMPNQEPDDPTDIDLFKAPIGMP